MPSVSKKQHNFMAAVAKNPAFAKKAGVPQSVGEDFLTADKGKKFGSSGTRPDKQAVNSPKTNHGAKELFSKGGDTMAKSMKALFAGKESKKEEAAERKAFPSKMAYKKAEAKYEGETMKKGGATKKMASGGITTAKMGAVKSGGNRGHGEHSVQSKGHTKGKSISMTGSKPLGMKRGGKC